MKPTALQNQRQHPVQTVAGHGSIVVAPGQHLAGSVTIQFAPAESPEPKDSFIADFTIVQPAPTHVRLFFAKRHPLTGKATKLVEVTIPWTPLRKVWPAFVANDFLDRLRAHAAAMAPDWRPEVATHLDEAPFFSRTANFVAAAYSAEESCLDFSWYSASDAAEVVRGTKRQAELRPVLRVVMSVCHLAHLLAEVEACLQAK